jgi:hypothetical protein
MGKTKAKDVRVELDLRAFGLLRSEAARGILAVAQEVIARTDVWDQSPYGEGLIDKGAAVAFVDGDRIGGQADLPGGESSDGIVAYAGFPFPARFNEIGTVNQPARPRITPAADSAIGDAEGIIARTVRMLR